MNENKIVTYLLPSSKLICKLNNSSLSAFKYNATGRCGQLYYIIPNDYSKIPTTWDPGELYIVSAEILVSAESWQCLRDPTDKPTQAKLSDMMSFGDDILEILEIGGLGKWIANTDY